jgi:poly(3-hydroxybutyrate) depolymerase
VFTTSHQLSGDRAAETARRRSPRGARRLLPTAYGLLLAAYCLPLADARPDDGLAPGRVIESVACKADAKQTYALYLPSGYTPDRRWPIVYAFDPIARGALPVERFREAAERFGYVVAGSNTSRNGPMNASVAAFAAMWDDTHERLSVDDRRVYTTGFSGGARVACWLAISLKGAVAGVVACGAGFPPQVKPERPVPFAFFGMAGDGDYNLPEVRRLGETLVSLGAPARVETFEGTHEWAPAATCSEAVEWMDLQAMKAGARAKDAETVARYAARQAERARAHESAGRHLAALRAYEALARDLDGLGGDAGSAREAARLRESAEVRSALKREREDYDRQQRVVAEFATHLELAVDPVARSGAMADMRRMIGDLRRHAADRDREYARRSLAEMWGMLRVAASESGDAAKYPLAASYLEVASEIRPRTPQLTYEIARLYARANDKKRALAALRRAVDEGFADAGLLAADEWFAPLRAEREYAEVVGRIKAGGSRH